MQSQQKLAIGGEKLKENPNVVCILYNAHLPSRSSAANDFRVPLGAPPSRSEGGDEDNDDEDEKEKEKEEPDYICASFADVSNFRLISQTLTSPPPPPPPSLSFSLNGKVYYVAQIEYLSPAEREKLDAVV